jgi:hypothetical protein
MSGNVVEALLEDTSNKIKYLYRTCVYELEDERKIFLSLGCVYHHDVPLDRSASTSPIAAIAKWIGITATAAEIRYSHR